MPLWYNTTGLFVELIRLLINTERSRREGGKREEREERKEDGKRKGRGSGVREGGRSYHNRREKETTSIFSVRANVVRSVDLLKG